LSGPKLLYEHHTPSISAEEHRIGIALGKFAQMRVDVTCKLPPCHREFSAAHPILVVSI
jgi:hypothetical protein